MIWLPKISPDPPRGQDWELAILTDGAWSVRFQGVERWLLHPCHISRADAARIERMMNSLGLMPLKIPSLTSPGDK
jgi:hypothetical protein